MFQRRRALYEPPTSHQENEDDDVQISDTDEEEEEEGLGAEETAILNNVRSMKFSMEAWKSKHNKLKMKYEKLEDEKSQLLQQIEELKQDRDKYHLLFANALAKLPVPSSSSPLSASSSPDSSSSSSSSSPSSSSSSSSNSPSTIPQSSPPATRANWSVLSWREQVRVLRKERTRLIQEVKELVEKDKKSQSRHRGGTERQKRMRRFKSSYLAEYDRKIQQIHQREIQINNLYRNHGREAKYTALTKFIPPLPKSEYGNVTDEFNSLKDSGYFDDDIDKNDSKLGYW